MTYTTLTKISISFIYGSPWSAIFGSTNILLHSGGMYYIVVCQIPIHITFFFLNQYIKLILSFYVIKKQENAQVLTQ